MTPMNHLRSCGIKIAWCDNFIEQTANFIEKKEKISWSKCVIVEYGPSRCYSRMKSTKSLPSLSITPVHTFVLHKHVRGMSVKDEKYLINDIDDPLSFRWKPCLFEYSGYVRREIWRIDGRDTRPNESELFSTAMMELGLALKCCRNKSYFRFISFLFFLFSFSWILKSRIKGNKGKRTTGFSRWKSWEMIESLLGAKSDWYWTAIVISRFLFKIKSLKKKDSYIGKVEKW